MSARRRPPTVKELYASTLWKQVSAAVKPEQHRELRIRLLAALRGAPPRGNYRGMHAPTLGSAFWWMATREGHIFWHRLANRILRFYSGPRRQRRSDFKP